MRPTSSSILALSSPSWLWRFTISHPGLRIRVLAQAENRRMPRLKDLSVAEIHVDAAGQARIETPHCAHDVNPLEIGRAVLFENRRVLHGIFVRSGRAVNVARRSIPWCWRIRMVIGDLAVANHHMM